MSQGQRHLYKDARRVADVMMDNLEPFCSRREIAGSLRRGEAMIGDVEIVVVPRLQVDLFGEPRPDCATLLDLYLERLVNSGGGYTVTGQAKQKKLSFKRGDVFWKIEIYVQPDPATWGVNYLLRTGSKEFSQRMVTDRSREGLKPDHFMVSDARVYARGDFQMLKPFDTAEEKDVFELWGLEYIEPKKRC